MSFPAYPSYQDSGADWLGNLPSHWEVVPYKRLVEIQNGADYKHVEQPEGYPVIGSGGQFTYASDYLYDGESVLLGRKGTIDKPLHVTGRFWTVDTMYWSKIRPGISGRFAYYTATAIPFGYYSTNTALPSMTQSALNAHLVGLPPLSEQTAIAAFLDRETAKIDALVEEQRRLIELLKEEVVSHVLKVYHAGGGTELRLEHAVDVVARPVIQVAGETYEPLGLFNRGRGLFHKDPRPAEEMGDSDFYWIEAGDLIISGQFAWEGAVAFAGEPEAGCVVSHRYPVLRGRPGVALTEYIFGLLLTGHGTYLLNEHSRGAAGRNRPLNLKSLLREKIVLPDLEAQAVVKDRIHSLASVQSALASQRALLQERRAALISAAVTGKIDVRDVATRQAEAA